jgi:photosystem II stability/assembly factor-like uncharacterized protein
VAIRLRFVKFLAAVLAGVLILTTPAAASAPTGFLPSSTSWLDATQGEVFGYAPCGAGLCPRLLATKDGGISWSVVNEPPVKLPDNHNQVKLTTVDLKNTFVSDGTTLWATNDANRSWYPVTLAGLASPCFISKVVMSHNRVFVMASSYGNGEAGFTQIYSGAPGAHTLRPVLGFTATGGLTYGDIAVDGDVIQAYLGADFASEQYGFSTDGIHFKAAPWPCPPAEFATLGGIRDGEPVVLCNGSGGSPAPGAMTKRVWTAPALGGTFAASGPSSSAGITQGFAAASATHLTIAAVGGGACLLHSSFDAGKSWTTTELSERGFGLFDLHFVTDKIGFVVDGVPDAGEGSAIYRSTDSGHSWQEITVGR